MGEGLGRGSNLKNWVKSGFRENDKFSTQFKKKIKTQKFTLALFKF